MKKISVALLVFILLAVTTMPVLASEESQVTPPRIFSLVGRITAIDATARLVTVNVWRGNYLLTPYLGKPLTVRTIATTRYLYKSSPTAIPVPITFEDLKVGNQVNVNGILANNVWTAYRITVGATMIHAP